MNKDYYQKSNFKLLPIPIFNLIRWETFTLIARKKKSYNPNIREFLSKSKTTWYLLVREYLSLGKNKDFHFFFIYSLNLIQARISTETAHSSYYKFSHYSTKIPWHLINNSITHSSNPLFQFLVFSCTITTNSTFSRSTHRVPTNSISSQQNMRKRV